MDDERVSRVVVDSAIAVHRSLGPGLLESAYATALEIELSERGVQFEREWPINGHYAGRPLGVVYRADMLVASSVLLEIKAVAALEPLHTAQILTYLRLSKLRIGLLLNFHALLMKDGIRRVLNGHP